MAAQLQIQFNQSTFVSKTARSETMSRLDPSQQILDSRTEELRGYRTPVRMEESLNVRNLH